MNGATRARLVRQALTESLLLAVAGSLPGRKTNPKLAIGICGKHGGEPSSVQFCYRVPMDYVSCSPYRVPIARLAAAQAAISGDQSETMRTA